MSSLLTVTNHGVEELEARQFEQSRKFFALPEEVKREIMMDDNLRCCSDTRHRDAVAVAMGGPTWQ